MRRPGQVLITVEEGIIAGGFADGIDVAIEHQGASLAAAGGGNDIQASVDCWLKLDIDTGRALESPGDSMRQFCFAFPIFHKIGIDRWNANHLSGSRDNVFTLELVHRSSDLLNSPIRQV